MTEDIYDMLEVIEQGYEDEYQCVNQDFITSIRKQLERGKELSSKQREAIENIYNKGK